MRCSDTGLPLWHVDNHLTPRRDNDARAWAEELGIDPEHAEVVLRIEGDDTWTDTIIDTEKGIAYTNSYDIPRSFDLGRGRRIEEQDEWELAAHMFVYGPGLPSDGVCVEVGVHDAERHALDPDIDIVAPGTLAGVDGGSMLSAENLDAIPEPETGYDDEGHDDEGYHYTQHYEEEMLEKVRDEYRDDILHVYGLWQEVA